MSSGNAFEQVTALWPGVERIDYEESFDHEVDVLVAGTGAAGFSAALHASRAGAEVLMVEKGGRLGGTTFKSHGWIWVPNNSFMREAGIEDRREDALAYMARVSRPHNFDPDGPTLGLPEWEYDGMAAFYDHGAESFDSLIENGDVRLMHGAEAPDYQFSVPQNKAPFGRVMMTQTAAGELGYGDELVAQLQASAVRAEIPILTEHRIGRVLVNAAREVVGAVAQRPDGSLVRFRARRGVVFCTGGFGHNAELVRNFLSHPTYGTCAAITNTGDFVEIAAELGAPLRNMNNAWYAPTTYEKWLRGSTDPEYMNLFAPPGDSMVFVNREGRRVLNEHSVYSELAQSFFGWDPHRQEYKNLFLFMVWDQPCQDHFAGVSNRSDNPIPLPDMDSSHVVTGASLADLTGNLRRRVADLGPALGVFGMSEDFAENLVATVTRFGEYAQTGIDPDFHRGENPIEVILQVHNSGTLREGRPSGQLHEFSGTGPYYALIVAPGTLDTKGGPRIDDGGRVLNAIEQPLPGLYAAGNCVASFFSRGYPGAGATLGPAFTFGRLAGLGAAAAPVKEIDGGTPVPATG